MNHNLIEILPETEPTKAVVVTRRQSAEQFQRDYECLRRLFDHARDAFFVHGPDVKSRKDGRNDIERIRRR